MHRNYYAAYVIWPSYCILSDMVSKTLPKKGAHTVIYAVLVLVLISALGLIFWNNFMRSEPHAPKDDLTYSIKGKITEKRTSCGEEILDDNGRPKHIKGICDAGNSIVINEVRISAGGGALTGNPPTYITNIDSVHAGDIVEVRYIKSEDGRPSTNCESCYIKKEGAQQKEPQIRQNR